MDYPHSDPKVGLHDGKFTDGAADGSYPPSLDTAAWSNAVTDEIKAVITAAGQIPAEGNNIQMAAAITAMIAANTIPDATTALKGKVELATVAEAVAGLLSNVAVTPDGLAAALANINLSVYLRASVAAVLSAGYYISPLTQAIAGGVLSPDFAGRNLIKVAVNATFTLTAPASYPAGGMAVIYATQDATGGRGLSVGAAYKVADGAYWSTVPNAVNILYLTFDGSGTIDLSIVQRGT